MAKNKVSFKLKSKLSELDTLCQHLERFGQSIGLSPKCIFEANLALDELFTNIITYGFNDKKEHTIEVTISHQNNKLIFNIEDDGIPFNPTKVDTPDLECTIEECKIGGLGIHLAKNLMDEVCYQRCKKKNILTLKKNIKEAEPAKKRMKG
ncbi:MAG: ATP-binding protein [Desulfobacterales bacterium]|jgi:anti-sigma regulatory factor (Ser/Thr protein kinase)|nr:ATP-binding protein [Desulfobacterales bacterium]MDH3827740.1 ATP-binding protein [Desulfobacterales bacterium]MDH4011648.1 ATP-binding protein [Desulfobacterales bacterium]